MYVNVGAQYAADKSDIPTKAALKRAIAANPAEVYFYGTSLIGDNGLDTGTLDILAKGVKYSVVGPNPYTNRKWYATVEITVSGAIRVS
jgi:hypothetical protein